ncbi:MAG: discoidin domain-containing protein, partial [Balneolales bacterium]
SGQLQEPDMWFQIDLPEAVKFTEVIFNSPSLPRSRAKTFPRGFSLEVSTDGNEWQQVKEGLGEDYTSESGWNTTATHLVFDPVEAKYIRLTQTEEVKNSEDPPTWSMRELQFYVR